MVPALALVMESALALALESAWALVVVRYPR
jgi:hypothetical protein